MIIIAYIWFFFLILSAAFFTTMLIIDKNIDENSKFGKWWRSNVIGIYPKDDINE